MGHPAAVGFLWYLEGSVGVWAMLQTWVLSLRPKLFCAHGCPNVGVWYALLTTSPQSRKAV